MVLSGCESQLSLKNDELARKDATKGERVVMFPDDDPSIPDGKDYFEKADKGNCASCHGAGNSGGVDLTNKEEMRKKKPVEQYMFIAYGKDGSTHPAMHDKLTKKQMWDLVFYVRSLSTPLLADEEYMKVDAVFGSNCAVCHGKKGFGDGPLAHHLEPVPANFQQFSRFYDRDDDQLWDHIANGIKWEGMPNFLNKQDKSKTVTFDQEYIWKLVQYVRAFHSSNVATIAQTPPPKAGSGAPSTTSGAAPAGTASNNSGATTSATTTGPAEGQTR